MKIATYNIDWAKKYQNKAHINKIENLLDEIDFDILIITEAIDLNLKNYKFKYATTTLPGTHENFPYDSYLKNTPANRVIIYSKTEAVAGLAIKDPYTSICKQFTTAVGVLTIYGTIIGTRYKKQPYADIELDNCIKDCLRLNKEVEGLCLAGDLNTCFIKNSPYIINKKTTEAIIKLANDCNMALTTANIENNIDHIFLPLSIKKEYEPQVSFFAGAEKLSDHTGICVELA